MHATKPWGMSRFSESEMRSILREAERSAVAQVSKAAGISEPTSYAWRKRFGAMKADEVRRLRQLAQENLRLKKRVAERDLEITAKKWPHPRVVKRRP